MKAGIKVKAPASIANLACGYDILGLAIAQTGDEMIGRLVKEPGVRIVSIRGDQGKIPKAVANNTAGVAVQKFLEFLGERSIGIELQIVKKIPVGSGLGSSASSAAAGVMVANELLRRPLTRRELLPFAVLGEYVADQAFHADNVAPALLGGVILMRDNLSLDCQRLYVPDGLFVTVVYPEVQVLTKEARAILKNQTPLKKWVKQSGNLGAFVLGMMQSDFDLIERSLQDVVIEEQRAALIPGFYDVKDAALRAGVLGCSIAGAGPSVFCLSSSKLKAENAAVAMSKVFKELKIDTRTYVSEINKAGTVLC